MRLALPAFLLAMLASAAAAAQPSRAETREARRYFEQGVEAIGRDDYAAALDAFERSYRLNPKSVTLFNIGMCQRAMADLSAAYNTLNRYLETASDDAPTRVEEARRVVAEIDDVLAQVTVRADRADAEISVDGLPAGLGAVTRPLRLTAGTHVFEAHLAGHRAAREVVDIGPGEQIEIQLTLGEASDVGETAGGGDDDDGDEGGLVTEWWFWTIIGAAVAGAAITTGVLLAPGEDRLSADWTIEGN
ncbi:MAG: PEGA domain-containing protein [Deltaproteobacteria bacterium]|nr:PEGA domain-containing protein [Deltaproteobacteria bacterium]